MEQLIELNLAGNLFEKFPGEVGKLSELELLNLENNKLVEFDKKVVLPSLLTTLKLGGNQNLKNLPPTIYHLDNLKILDIGDSGLIRLPEESEGEPGLSNLSELTHLDLRDNKLTSLPSTIYQLGALKVLDVSNNKLSKLPEVESGQADLSNLKDLTHLYLANTQLTDVPSTIYELINLEELDISENALKELPKVEEGAAGLSNLTKLTYLNLRKTQLVDLPAEIERLQGLITLSLAENQLKSLPPQVGQLRQLTELYLYENQLTDLPDAIGELTELRTLDLRGNNRLTCLHRSITELPLLEVLDVRGNNLTSPPQVIAEKGLAAIREWFSQNDGQCQEKLTF